MMVAHKAGAHSAAPSYINTAPPASKVKVKLQNMGSCNSTYEYQEPARPVPYVNPEEAAKLASEVRKDVDGSKPYSFGWDAIETQRKAIKLDPSNFEYQLLLLRVLAKNWKSFAEIERAYQDASELDAEQTGELEITYVEALLTSASRSRNAGSFPMASATKAIRRAQTLDQQNQLQRVAQFARAMNNTLNEPSEYSLAVIRYELAYIAEPHPQYLVLLADLASVGPGAWTDAAVLAFRRAETALQNSAPDTEAKSQLESHVRDFFDAEKCLQEVDRLLALGDVAGAAAQARQALETCWPSARPYKLLWQCVDNGGADDQYLEDLKAAQEPPAANFHSSWLVDCRARQGMFLLKRGDYDEGMKHLKSALDNEPNNQKWLDAKHQAEVQKLGSEAAYLEQFAGVTDITVLRSAALKFYDRKRFVESARILELALEHIPSRYTPHRDGRPWAVLYGERADSLYKAEQYAAAAEEYEKACKEFDGMYVSAHVWPVHREACLDLASNPTKPLPRHLAWLTAHDAIHGSDNLEPRAEEYANLAAAYAAEGTLPCLRKAVEIYEVAWTIEGNRREKTREAKRSEWWAKRRAVGARIEQLCPTPPYVESEESKRQRMQAILQNRRLGPFNAEYY